MTLRPGSPAAFAVVGLGGFCGGLARYGLGLAWPESAHDITWTTLAINCVGSFALPVLVLLVTAVAGAPAWVRPLLGTGFLGAFTTFSALAFAVERRLAEGAVSAAGWTLALSLGVGLTCSVAGYLVGGRLARRVASRRDARNLT